MCLRQQKEYRVTGRGAELILPGLAGIWTQRRVHSLWLLEQLGLGDGVTVNLLGRTVN